jgi:hypothetical protein
MPNGSKVGHRLDRARKQIFDCPLCGVPDCVPALNGEPPVDFYMIFDKRPITGKACAQIMRAADAIARQDGRLNSLPILV